MLLVPWRTLAGLVSEPGQLSRIGPVTAEVARALAAIAATTADSEWRLVVTGRAGNALAVTHIRKTWLRPAGRPAATACRASSRPAVEPVEHGMIARVTLTVPLAFLGQPGGPGHEGWPCSPQLRTVLAAALRAAEVAAGRARTAAREAGGAVREAGGAAREAGGAVREAGGAIREAGGAARGFAAGAAQSADGRNAIAGALGSIAGALRGGCRHQDAAPGYRIPDRMRALLEARDGTCRFPGCRRPAWRCDQDHTIPYQDGGPTCPCNLSSECRHHHRLKQLSSWQLTQNRPGVLTWRTPARLVYPVRPDPHPA